MSHKTLLYSNLLAKWQHHIHLIKSTKWNNCNIVIDNNTVTSLPSIKDYMIEVKFVHHEYNYKPTLTLYINDMIYYEYNKSFNLNILLDTNTYEINDIVKYIEAPSTQKQRPYSYNRSLN